jgi:hypothetical protein
VALREMTVSKLTPEELAARLTGREYTEEITEAEAKEAAAAGLVVIFGASDDLVEIRGLFTDEEGAYGGGTVLLDRHGVIPGSRNDRWPDEKMEQYFARKRAAVQVEALWCAEPGYSWTFKTDRPHATFEVVEDGEPYCRGIVLALPEAP